MPIIDQTVTDGPNARTDGRQLGTVVFVFDDGRKVSKNLNEPNLQAWSEKLVDLAAEVEAQIQQNDADDAVENDEEVQDYRQANKRQLALAYLRRAKTEEYPFDAYRKFVRFNDWRLAEGYTLNQVQTALASVGLTAEEWGALLDAYQWLNGGARPSVMQAYEDVRIGWLDHQG